MSFIAVQSEKINVKVIFYVLFSIQARYFRLPGVSGRATNSGVS
ncbi:MAG: hypothetical protein CM1200mP29_10950 [Verrucomicrobiota bacterium]|nr:MAG: hypothetical protein CM1200mP29_10950 [Verrucomicrobiota bacterium]